MKIVRKILLSFLLGFPCLVAARQPGLSGSMEAFHQDTSYFAPMSDNQLAAPIYFQIGRSDIDPGFMGNGSRLENFVTSLRHILSDSNYVVSRVVVAGTASPDGNERRNLSLAGARAQSLADYLIKHTGLGADKIEVVNRGENWSGLRAMIESSDMPYKKEMLMFMDSYADDRDTRKRKMQYYADSEPWLWMYEHFFPILRTGAGGTSSHERLSELRLGNWERIRNIILGADIDEELRSRLLKILDLPNASERMARLKEVCPAGLYASLQEQAMSSFLGETSILSEDNWTMLRKMIASSDMDYRDEVLSIIDNVPIGEGRESRLQALHEGKPYAYIKEHFFPELLKSDHQAHSETLAGIGGVTTLSAENWKRLRTMIASSSMPGRQQVLDLIDSEPDLALRGQKLRDLNGGESYRYISEVFFPELLYGVSPATQENWKLLADAISKSDLPNKERILEIIATTAPGVEREHAIRLLDNDRSWEQMSNVLLPELLLDMEVGEDLGSGMSFYYEPSPSAKVRAEELRLQAEELRKQEKQRIEEQQRQAEQERLAAEQARAEAEEERERLQQEAQMRAARKEERKIEPLISVKTDIMMWSSLMPSFRVGTFTPNLSTEIYFAGRWSAQVGWAYANWNSFSSQDGLFASSTLDLEARYWCTGDDRLYRGLFVSVYGSYGDYDVQDNSSPTGQTGTFFSAGIGGGWLQPLSRHWSLEAQVRLGYRSASNEFYDIDRGHYYLDRKQSQGDFVPQFRLQVVYRFGKPVK